jgi:hypothetical protein
MTALWWIEQTNRVSRAARPARMEITTAIARSYSFFKT